MEIKFTAQVGGTTYQSAAWWAMKDGYAVAGPTSSLREIRRQVADINRRIKSGEYADR
jgi:methionine aminopeptidase